MELWYITVSAIQKLSMQFEFQPVPRGFKCIKMSRGCKNLLLHVLTICLSHILLFRLRMNDFCELKNYSAKISRTVLAFKHHCGDLALKTRRNLYQPCPPPLVKPE